MHHKIPDTEPTTLWHLGHVYQQVGDYVPNGGVDVDPQGTVKRYPGRFDEVERVVRSRWPFLHLGFDLLHRQWVWYRLDREHVAADFGSDLGIGGYSQDVVTIVQSCSDALWETRNCPRLNSVVHAYRYPSIGEDVSLLDFIERDHPEQFQNKSFGPWVGKTMQREYRAREAKRLDRIHRTTSDAVEEWSHLVDLGTAGGDPTALKFKTSIAVPKLLGGRR